MWNIVKFVFGLLLSILIFLVFIELILGNRDFTNYLAIALAVVGLILAIIGVLASITRNSPIKVGAISRSEFYGVMAVVLSVGVALYIATQNRIDQIMLILAKH